MKVIFLDFDGVLNSAASFLYEGRIRDNDPDTLREPVNNTLCHVCTSNFIRILEECPDVKVVISSTWRELYSMEWLKEKLKSYGIDSDRVIDRTPSSFRGYRGGEIDQWLAEHPEVTDFVILDDNSDMEPYMDKFVKTTWATGLTLPHVYETIKRLKGTVSDEQDSTD